jgi:hypothetical protein
MNSSEFKSESITRHMALKSNQHILTVGHKELFKALEVSINKHSAVKKSSYLFITRSPLKYVVFIHMLQLV